jgi:hypothetical protein
MPRNWGPFGEEDIKHIPFCGCEVCKKEKIIHTEQVVHTRGDVSFIYDDFPNSTKGKFVATSQLKTPVVETEQTPGDGAFSGFATRKHAAVPGTDPVNHPKHYTKHPGRCVCGETIECIQITEHYCNNLGNVIKYIWRAEEKGAPLQDLKKALWYLTREIQKRSKVATDKT